MRNQAGDQLGNGLACDLQHNVCSSGENVLCGKQRKQTDLLLPGVKKCCVSLLPLSASEEVAGHAGSYGSCAKVSPEIHVTSWGCVYVCQDEKSHFTHFVMHFLGAEWLLLSY